jgi:hypothetical protein
MPAYALQGFSLTVIVLKIEKLCNKLGKMMAVSVWRPKQCKARPENKETLQKAGQKAARAPA